MKLVAQIKLCTTTDDARSLRATLESANQTADWMSARAFETRTFRQFSLHHLVYAEARERFGLSAQMIVRLVSKVADAYKLDHKTKRTFRPLGAISYDSRILSWKMDTAAVSIWTVDGRKTISFVCGKRARELLRHQQGETDLVYIKGKFFLFATCNVESPTPRDVTDFLGIDLGVANIATDSDGEWHSGKQLLALRHRHRRLRKRLQAKRTRSAKKLLKRRSAKEARLCGSSGHADTIAAEMIRRAAVNRPNVARCA